MGNKQNNNSTLQDEVQARRRNIQDFIASNDVTPEQPQDVQVIRKVRLVDCCVCYDAIPANGTFTVYKCPCQVTLCNECFVNWWNGHINA